jgi:tRNA (uracil-5-)-methyltransferase TRM9
MMHTDTILRLLEVNRQFYRHFAAAFAATRQRVQPGVRRMLEELPARGDWLDLGCGNGAVAAAWLNTPNRKGSYTGLDASPELLDEARRWMGEAGAQQKEVSFYQADLANDAWSDVIEDRYFNVITAFAVLHHLPGVSLRQQVLHQAYDHLYPDGLFVHSEWQFQHSARLMARRQPWEKISLSEDMVDEGDALLDWRFVLPGQEDQVGLRYVHLFNRDELAELALTTGFEIVEEFESDGREGNLALYQVWRRG